MCFLGAVAIPCLRELLAALFASMDDMNLSRVKLSQFSLKTELSYHYSSLRLTFKRLLTMTFFKKNCLFLKFQNIINKIIKLFILI